MNNPYNTYNTVDEFYAHVDACSGSVDTDRVHDTIVALTEARAEVEQLQKALRTVAERQREACAKEAEGVEARGHGMDADEAGTRDACVDAVRAAPLVTKENS